ncbi:alpha/beta hydrolase [Fischerella thermalis CCMEE 5201]|jgi:pimeloyl-ACP methyl ester carboxylesterase|nr:alpha/beta hydrolase [Fischerella thermalis CCMEE 5201]
MYNTLSVEVKGDRYYLQDSGSGKECVLLLHGWPDDSNLWRNQVSALVNAGYRVICPDLLGYGLSDQPQDIERYTIFALANDIISLLDSLGLDKVHLVAHDYGAVIGWEIATVYSTRLKSFVAMSVGHLACLLDLSFDILRYEWIYFLNIHQVAPQLYRASNGRLLREVLRTHPDKEQILQRALKPGVLEAMQKLEQANPLPEILLASLEGKLPEPQLVSVATFAIWSDHDDFLWEAQIKESSKYVTAAWRYERVAKAGHWFMLEQPEKTNCLLLDWLGEH